MVFKKIIFQNRYVALETPSRPPPFMANTILNFHFDYLHPSLRVDEDDGLFSLDILYSWKEILLLTWEDGMWAKEA